MPNHFIMIKKERIFLEKKQYAKAPSVAIAVNRDMADPNIPIVTASHSQLLIVRISYILTLIASKVLKVVVR